MDEIILAPPEAPNTSLTRLLLSTTIIGDMEESGRLPGAIKFASLGAYPNMLFKPGVLKSFIVLEYMIPVCSPTYEPPKLF